MSPKPTILTDPLQVTKAFPGLQTALHQWVDENKPRPWDRSALNDFLASYAYEVKVGPVVWAVYYEGFQIRAHAWNVVYDKAHGTPTDQHTLDAYAMALGLLQTEVHYAEQIAAERVEWVKEGQRERLKWDTEAVLNL